VVEENVDEGLDDLRIIGLFLCDSCLFEERDPLGRKRLDGVVSLSVKMDEMLDRSGARDPVFRTTVELFPIAKLVDQHADVVTRHGPLHKLLLTQESIVVLVIRPESLGN